MSRRYLASGHRGPAALPAATRGAFALPLALGLWLAGPVRPSQAAQDGPREEDLPSDVLVSDWKLGPFYAKPSLAVENVGIDSNVFLDGEDDDPKDDFTATVTPGIRLALPFGENVLTGRASASYVWFAEYETERAWNYSAGASLDALLGSMRLELWETFRRTQERYGSEILTRPQRFENDLGARLGTDRDAGVYVEARAASRAYRFDDEETFEGASLSEDLDRNELETGFAALLELLESARLVGGFDWHRDDFRFDETLRDGSGWFAFGGLRFEPGSALTGDVRVGWETLDVERPGHPDYGEIGFEASLEAELGESARLTLVGSRRPEFSTYEDNVWAVLSEFEARLLLPLADSFAIELAPRWLQSEYPLETELVTGGGLERTDDLTSFEAAGIVAVGEDVGARIGIVARRLESTVPGVGYGTSYLLTAGLVYGR